MTVAQRQVRVHGQHVTDLVAGVGRGPVVVLLHGLASIPRPGRRHVAPRRRAYAIAHDRVHRGPGAGRRERADPGRHRLGGQLLRLPRVDTEIDKRLAKIGTDEALALRGKAGVVNSRLAYAAFQKVFQGTPERLPAQGAKPQPTR